MDLLRPALRARFFAAWAPKKHSRRPTESDFASKASCYYNLRQRPDLEAIGPWKAKNKARDLETTLAGMHLDVQWSNGMEGGTVHGHSGVRQYWTRQWGMIDPHVDPVRFHQDEAGRTVIAVSQVVRDLAGTVLVDQMIEHIYTIENGLIRKMEIRQVDGSGS